MLNSLKQKIKLHLVKTANPGQLMRLSEDKAVRAFKNAAINIPAYRAYLKQHNVLSEGINSIDAFKEKVPIINKEKTFKLCSNEIKKLCLRGELRDVKTVISSSGHSGCFSFGLNTERELRSAQNEIDIALESIFSVKKKKTLLVNALPMGVKVNSALTTVVDTSVRSDIVLAVVKTFWRCYDQIIIVAENSFAKKILEEGQEEGIDWKDHTIHLVLAEEILPENLRSYLANLLGVDLDSKKPKSIIGSSFGISEFGLNIFFETLQTIGLRRLMQHDDKLKQALIGKEGNCLPMIFQYNPLRFFVEETKVQDHSHLVLTSLDCKTILPLIRYDIEDDGNILSYESLKQILESQEYLEYLPELKLPLAIIWGRQTLTTPQGLALRPGIIKETLYKNFETAKMITGYFRLSISGDELKIEIQLRHGRNVSAELEHAVKEILAKNLAIKTNIVFYPYREFPYGMELDYERKFEYI